MNKSTPLLTIKEFSLLTHTTIDTLKHYDNINLLKPAYIGTNRYRYYSPDQSLLLTRILFCKDAGFPLKDIKKILQSESPDTIIKKYEQIAHHLKNHIIKTTSFLSAITNLKYYYSLSKRYKKNTLFSIYLPEAYILISETTQLYISANSSQSNIANTLFTKGFIGENWPHYLLGILVNYKNFIHENPPSIRYFLKTDHPELYHKKKLLFTTNGEYLCMLFNQNETPLTAALSIYLHKLTTESQKIRPNIYIMSVVNSLITSNPNEYCTLIYAFKEEQPYEQL